MSWSYRRVLVVLTAVAILGSASWLQTAFGQKQQAKIIQLPIGVNPGVPTTGSADAAAFDLPKDTEMRRRIEAAHDYINAKRWEEVVVLLQRILDDQQDKFAPLLRKGPDGKEVEVPTSVRAEANRLLANLPKEGLEAYKTYGEAGPKASEYLKKAKDASTTDERLALFRMVVRKYLHTDAGGEAADLLATHHMDHGDFRTASRFFSLLLTRAGGADELPAETLFRAAYAFNQAGDKANEEMIWQTARARGIREIKFGDEAKSVNELQDYLAGIGQAVESIGRQWAYFLGDASRTGKGEGGPAFMVRDWKQPTAVIADPTHGTKLSEMFDAGDKRLTAINQPVIPSQFPVTATVTKKDGQKLSLIALRTHAGVAAINMRTGKWEGLSTMRGTWDWMMAEPGRENALNQWLQVYVGNLQQPQQPGIQPGQRPSILFENTTIGSLSTDGQYAYTVEDLVVPPPAQFRQQMAFPGAANQNPYGWPQDLVNMVNHSRLVAFDLAAGCKIVWDVPALDDTKSELADSYFLGPPLSVNGKLYVMAEKQTELRLICMENVRVDGVVQPQIDSVLSLGTARDSKLQIDVLRRLNAAHLSYGEGVLVCPTNLGYVIGIDLLQDSLLWAFPYRDATDAATANAAANPFGRALPPGVFINGMQNMQAPLQQGWKTSAPIIQDGKVVFTAFDSKSIHCVNLKDGTPAWSRGRQESNNTDLYLGGVVDGKVIVVGTKTCHAYNLSNGDEAWTVETGMPSGFGAASDNTYYLPLKTSTAGKEPEICAIDVDHGVITGHSKARSPDTDKLVIPGNLIFFDGGIVSQTNDEIAKYPQLKIKIAQMTERLKNNPNDVQGLFERGEFSLEEGNLEAAVQDFLEALKNNPAADLQGQVKSKLFDALTEHFQHNFDQAEKYQADYAALCSTELPATATDAERAEARRRRTNFLYLLAKGKEGQRKLTEAFDKYMALNAEAQPEELLSLVDERLVKAAPDVLAQGRIAAMVAGATEEERKPLEARIAARWKEIQAKNDPAELRKFVTLFGSLFSVGQEARLQLAEQLMNDEKDPNALMDAERQLSLLRARTQDPELAARAVECLARLNTRKGLLEDAAYYYRVLRDFYPNVKVDGLKTGADLFNEMATDKRLWANLDDSPRFGASGNLKASEERETFAYQNQIFKFAHAGEPLPFYQRYSLGLQFNSTTADQQELKLTDRTNGEPRWKTQIARTLFQQIAAGTNNQQMVMNPAFPPGFANGQGGQAQPPLTPKFSYMTLGHLIVLPVGHMVFGFDAVTGHKLWEKNLFNPVSGPANPSVVANMQIPSVTVDPRDGGVQVIYQDGWTQHLGQTGPLEGAAVCLQMKDALTAVDPISGRVLWTRSDVSSRSRIFGDDQNLFVVEMSQEGKPAFTRVFRAYDGATAHAPDFRQAYEDRIRLVGRDILTADKTSDATTLRLYDPLTGKDLWKQAFPAKSYVLQGEDGDLAGVVEPEGQVHVVDLKSRKEVLNAASKIDPKYLDKDMSLTILSDASDVYIACNGPIAPNTRINTNLMPGTGLRGLNLNGELYAFRRENGKVHWHSGEANQQLVLDQFQEMPMVLMTAQVTKYPMQFTGVVPPSKTSLAMIDKRTGKLLGVSYGPAEDASHDNFPGGPIYALEVDGRNGKIQIVSPQERISVTLTSEKAPAPTP